MSNHDKEAQDAIYADEPWAKLATEAGFRPWDTESSAREAFRYCAENMVQRDLAEALAAALAIALSEHEGNHGVMCDSRDPHWSNDARAALAAWEARK